MKAASNLRPSELINMQNFAGEVSSKLVEQLFKKVFLTHDDTANNIFYVFLQSG